MKIEEKLWHIQQNLKAPKSQYNKFGDFHYRSCEDIQEAVKPLLKEVKAILLIGDEIVQIGNRFYIKATAALQDIESAERIVNTAYAREVEEKPKMDAAQVTGSCSSYARKYALNDLFCIDDSKDPDYAAQEPRRGGSGRTSRQQPEQKIKVTAAELDKLKKEAYRTGTALSAVCNRYKATDLKNLTHEQYLRAMSAFKKMGTVPPPAPEREPEFEETYAQEELPFR